MEKNRRTVFVVDVFVFLLAGGRDDLIYFLCPINYSRRTTGNTVGRAGITVSVTMLQLDSLESYNAGNAGGKKKRRRT